MVTHTVLIPLDGSAFSRHILPHVRHLLDPASWQVTLLRVDHVPEGISATPPQTIPVDGMLIPSYATEQDVELAQHPLYDTQIEESVRSALEDEIQSDVYYLQAAGFSVSVLVCFGNPAREIVDVVNAKDIDLVAMATHGRTGIRRAVLGSVAAQVLRRVSVPVLMVRPFE